MLSNIAATIGNLACSVSCTKKTQIPGTNLNVCVGVDFDDDLCTETATIPGFSVPSCTCDSVPICGSISFPKPWGGSWSKSLCMPFEAPKLPCNCCAEWKYYDPSYTKFGITLSLPGNGIKYCGEFNKVQLGPWTYCKKFW